MTTLYIVLGVIVIVVLWLILSYNRLVSLRLRAKEAISDIEVQLKRRYDLIPNLVEMVKGYVKHERGTLEAVVQARAKATQMTIDPARITPEQIKALSGVQLELSQALGRLLALSESYPDLKANTNFLELQRELADTENKIQAARRFYNTTVMELNNAIQTFPTNLMARPFGFKEEVFFDAPEAEEAPVKVQF